MVLLRVDCAALDAATLAGALHFPNRLHLNLLMLLMSFDIRSSDILAMWHGLFTIQFPRSDRKAGIFELPLVEGVFELIERSLAKTRQHRSPKRERRALLLCRLERLRRGSGGRMGHKNNCWRTRNPKSMMFHSPHPLVTAGLCLASRPSQHTPYQSRQEPCFTYHKKGIVSLLASTQNVQCLGRAAHGNLQI